MRCNHGRYACQCQSIAVARGDTMVDEIRSNNDIPVEPVQDKAASPFRDVSKHPSIKQEFVRLPAPLQPPALEGSQHEWEDGEITYPPLSMYHTMGDMEESFANHQMHFEFSVSAMRQQIQSAEIVNREIFASLTEKRKHVRHLEAALKRRDDEIVQLIASRQKEAELLAKAENVIETAGNIEQLQSENSSLRKINQEMLEELSACKKAKAESEASAKQQADMNAEIIKDLQDQLKQRLDEITTMDDRLLVPTILRENCGSRTRLQWIHDLGDTLATLILASKALIARVSPSRLDEITSISDLPPIFSDSTDELEEKLRSAVRGGAQLTLGIVMTHYPEADAGRIAAGFPSYYRDNTVVDEDKVLDSVAGYASKIAKAVSIYSTFPERSCPPTPEQFIEEETEAEVSEGDASRQAVSQQCNE